jgi:hypothetical protein
MPFLKSLIKSDNSSAPKMKRVSLEGPFARLSALATFTSSAIALFALFMAWDNEKLAGLAFWRTATISASLPESIVLSELLGLAHIRTTMWATQSGGSKTTIARATLKFTNTDTRAVFELAAKTTRLENDRFSQSVPWQPFGMYPGRSAFQIIDFQATQNKADFVERRNLAFRISQEKERLANIGSVGSYLYGDSANSAARSDARSATEAKPTPQKTFDPALQSQIVTFRNKHNPFKKGLHELCLLLFDEENRLVSHAGYRFNLDVWEADALEDEFASLLRSGYGGFLRSEYGGWSTPQPVYRAISVGFSGFWSGSLSTSHKKVPEVTLESSKDAKCATAQP